jgi:mono/diheme cytochrome c family protein
MKSIKIKKLTLAFIALFFLIQIGVVVGYQATPWVAPEKYQSMANPVPSSATSIAKGKALFVKNCIDCHGKKGLGDGSKVSFLKTTPADMTTVKFQSQSDGSLFYKISEGRNDMPKGKKDFPDESDRWNLVNYVRTFKQ